MCECRFRISELESDVRRLRAEQERHEAWHERRNRERAVQEVIWSALGLGAVLLFCGTFLTFSALLSDSAVRYAWAPGVPLMAGGVYLILSATFGVFAPATSATRTTALS